MGEGYEAAREGIALPWQEDWMKSKRNEHRALRTGEEMWAGRHRRWSDWIWDVKLGHAGSHMAEQSRCQERPRMVGLDGNEGFRATKMVKDLEHLTRKG